MQKSALFVENDLILTSSLPLRSNEDEMGSILYTSTAQCGDICLEFRI
jgi:hypothetical protein